MITPSASSSVHSQCPQLHKLLVINPSDRRLMDDCRIQMPGINLGDGSYLCMIHNDRVTLDMCVTFCISNCLWMEHLPGGSFCHRTRNNLRGTSLAIQIYFHIRLCRLLIMSHQLLQHIQFRSGTHVDVRLPHGRINTFYLCRVQREDRIIFHIDLCHRVQHSCAGSLSFSVVLFLIAHIGAFSHMEGMDSIVTALIAAAVVDPAAGYNCHVCTFRDIEIIIYNVRHARRIHNHRDVNLFAFRVSVNIDINSWFVFLFPDFNVLTVAMAQCDPIMS